MTVVRITVEVVAAALIRTGSDLQKGGSSPTVPLILVSLLPVVLSSTPRVEHGKAGLYRW